LIAKTRTVPLRIQIDEALLRRLPKNHPKRPVVKEDLWKRSAGYSGEENLDYHLKFLNSSTTYTVFHDIRLRNGQNYFQIDTLLLSSTFILIIEVKNLYGTLFFDKNFNQLIRTLNNKEEGFPNPISQVSRQQIQLENWVANHQFPKVPIDYLIAINDSRTIIKTDMENSWILEKVCHTEHIINKIAQVEKLYLEEKFTPKDSQKMSSLLIKKHTNKHEDISQLYGINKEQLITGVQCQACNSIPMERQYGTWYCQACNSHSKDAHIQTMQDYFLLFNSTITNPQLRQFLHIPSKYTASRILASLNLLSSGKGKGRVYSQPPIDY
jgi:hypothetical protein